MPLGVVLASAFTEVKRRFTEVERRSTEVKPRSAEVKPRSARRYRGGRWGRVGLCTFGETFSKIF